MSEFLIHQQKQTLGEKCTDSELFWSKFFHIWTEYGEIQSISPYSVQMRENTDQNNFEYGHFLRSEAALSPLLSDLTSTFGCNTVANTCRIRNNKAMAD